MKKDGTAKQILLSQIKSQNKIMSMFVQIQNIKAHLNLSYSGTPKQLTDSSVSKNVIISVEHYLRSEYVKEAYKSRQQQQEWVLSKSIFNLSLAQEETTAVLLAGQTKINNYKMLRNDQDEFRVLLRTPISLLLSEDKKQKVVEKVEKSNQIPLYSDKCKIILKFYLVQKQATHQQILRLVNQNQPTEIIQIKRAQITDIIRNFTKKSSIKSNNRTVNLRQLSEHQKFSSYEGTIKQMLSWPKTSQQYKTYMYSVLALNKTLQIKHQINLQFVIAVEKLRECAGFMRAGYSKAFSMDKGHSNYHNQMSQYVIKDGNSNHKNSKIGHKIFAYDMDFSRKNFQQQSHESTGQKFKHEPQVKSPNRPIRQPGQYINQPIQKTKEPHQSHYIKESNLHINQTIQQQKGHNKSMTIKQPSRYVNQPTPQTKEHNRPLPIKEPSIQIHQENRRTIKPVNSNQQALNQNKSIFGNIFNFACCKQTKNDDDHQINIQDPQELKQYNDQDYDKNKSDLKRKQQQKNFNQINQRNQTQPKEERQIMIENKYSKPKQPKQQISFYKGPCKGKNLFSALDPKRENQIFNALEPHYI